MKVVALAVVLVVAWFRPAGACGVWFLTDKEQGREVEWLISSGHIKKGDKQIAALYLDLDAKPSFKVTVGKKVLFDFAGKNLRKHGKKIGTLDGDTVTIGKKTFTIVFGTPGDYHGFPAWELTVKRGDDVILETAEATDLCAPLHRAGMTEADQQQEIRQRIAYYLAWREVGAS